MSSFKKFMNGLGEILKKIWAYSSIIILVCFVGGCFFFISVIPESSSLGSIGKEDSILMLKLEGMIIDPSKLLHDLDKYVKEDRIKGVLIRINSGGGVVSPSEEIYREILRVKKTYKKPVVVSIGSVGASGAFYVAMAGDKIVANESSILGSVGVIMHLSNLEELYDWAKIQRYVIKTGEFKDAGSDSRSLTPRERDLFQDMVDQLLAQFKEAIVESRSLSTELVDEFSDGRIFLGETALVQGFIDQIGTYRDALSLVGKMSGLGEDPEIFEPPEKIKGLWKDVLYSFLSQVFPFQFKNFYLLNQRFQGQPLYIMPERLGL